MIASSVSNPVAMNIKDSGVLFQSVFYSSSKVTKQEK